MLTTVYHERLGVEQAIFNGADFLQQAPQAFFLFGWWRVDQDGLVRRARSSSELMNANLGIRGDIGIARRQKALDGEHMSVALPAPTKGNESERKWHACE